MSNLTEKKISVKCPKCLKEFFYYESKFRPFCSERCRLIDLGHWLEGTYAIPVQENNNDSEDEINETEETLNQNEKENE